MSRFKLTINLSKLPDVKESEMDGVKGIFIPENALFVYRGKKGMYANLIANDAVNDRYNNSHFIVVDRPDGVGNIPIVGTMSFISKAPGRYTPINRNESQGAPAPEPHDDGLPM